MIPIQIEPSIIIRLKADFYVQSKSKKSPPTVLWTSNLGKTKRKATDKALFP